MFRVELASHVVAVTATQLVGSYDAPERKVCHSEKILLVEATLIFVPVF